MQPVKTQSLLCSTGDGGSKSGEEAGLGEKTGGEEATGANVPTETRASPIASSKPRAKSTPDVLAVLVSAGRYQAAIEAREGFVATLFCRPPRSKIWVEQEDAALEGGSKLHMQAPCGEAESIDRRQRRVVVPLKGSASALTRREHT